MYVWSERLGLAGYCDVVEQRDGLLYPVEYKKGKPGRWRNDHAQLCAQALCLEERTGLTINEGALFYFAVRRREVVAFTAEIRADVEALAAQAHQLIAAGSLPPHIEQRTKCRDCSLQPLCLPDETRLLNNFGSVPAWERDL